MIHESRVPAAPGGLGGYAEPRRNLARGYFIRWLRAGGGMAVGTVAGLALAAIALAAAAATRHRTHRGGDTVTGTDPDWGTGPYSFVAAVAAQYIAGHRPRLGNRLRE